MDSSGSNSLIKQLVQHLKPLFSVLSRNILYTFFDARLLRYTLYNIIIHDDDYFMAAQRLVQQLVAEIIVTVLGDFRLLFRVAMVFERQYDRIVGRLESRLGDRFDHLPS